MKQVLSINPKREMAKPLNSEGIQAYLTPTVRKNLRLRYQNGGSDVKVIRLPVTG